ncbi:MAG: putative Ig domain-containing protein, partial [Candidatus Sulfotelmatobacter sp.]
MILNGTLPAGEVGVRYNDKLHVSRGSAPYHFSISWGELPPGLSLAPDKGSIYGRPTHDGTFNFGIHVTDACRRGAAHRFHLIIAKGGSPVVTVTPASANVIAGGTLQFAATVANSLNAGVTWSASGGTISSTGLFRAASATVRTRASVTAISKDDPSQSATALIALIPPPASLSITSTFLPDAMTEISYMDILAATGGKAPYTWTLTFGSLPTGISLQSGGTLSGTSSQIGEFSL